MEVMLVPLLILFFILVAGFGIENTFKILPPLIFLGLLIYFLGWVAIKYFWIIVPIWFLSKLLSNKNKERNSTYSRTYKILEVILVQQTEELMVEHLIVEKKLKNFLELSLVEVLVKVQGQQVLVILMVGIVIKMVVEVIKEIPIIHIQRIKVNTTLF